jgi:PAS domain S-box-containing protein
MSRTLPQKQVHGSSVAQLPQLTPDLYREIFVHSHEAIAIISPQGHYIEQNGAHFQLLGYSDAELEGQTPAIHMGEQQFAEIVRELVGKGNFRGEVVSRTKDGQERHIDLSAFTMRNSVGEPLCYIGIKRDITARKNAEEALRRSENELSDFFETATIGMQWVAPDGKILRVNEAELDMLGYTREEYLGHHISEFHVDRESIEEVLRRVSDGEVLRDREARMRAKDGSIKFVQMSLSAQWANDKFLHTRCFTSDITERRRAQQRLALQYAVTKVLSDSSDFTPIVPELLGTICECLGWEVGLLWLVNKKGTLLYCADVWHQPGASLEQFEKRSRSMTFERGVGLPGRIWASAEPAWISNIVADSNFPRSEDAAAVGLRGAVGFPILIGNDFLGAIEFLDREIQQPDEDLLKVMHGLGGQIGQFKERVRAEKELALLLCSEKSARSDAEKANRLKDEFLATLSHELRTPLNAVIGWSRMLRMGRLDKSSATHALEVIERNAWAQQQIIEDILDVSRVITGKLQLNVGPVSVDSVVEAAIDAVRPALQAKEIRIETSMPDTVNLILGDPDRLRQVVWNLLSNAAKFTPARGQVRIVVRQEPSRMQISVEDSGPGIDPQFLPHVFERFRQADGSTTRTHGGLGLGLAIVRHLVELHGGTIAAENRSNGTSGAIFTVTLPLPSNKMRAKIIAEGYLHKEAECGSVQLEGVRILAVDDELDALDMITIELKQHGASVIGVTSAIEALSKLETEDFDLLIADIGMPDIDGYELIRKIRQNEAGTGKRMPAVALTAYARVQDRMRAVVSGYNTHVAKPIEINELLTVVASLAGRYDRN